jgi:hypothetical protein
LVNGQCLIGEPPHEVSVGRTSARESRPGAKWRKRLSLDGALRLAEVIRQFWQGQGFEVETTVEQFVGHGGGFGVRSNLVDGLPGRKHNGVLVKFGG